MKPKLQVLIAEPSDIIREGLSALLDEEEFVMQAPLREIPADMAQRIGRQQPDILILNPTLLNTPPRMQLVAIQQARTSMAVVALVYQYVKQSRLRHFDAVIDIRDSRASILQAVLGLSAKTGAGDNALSNHELTRRETAVLVEVAKGLSNKEIASRLNVSVFTVTTHRKNIVRKTGIKSVAGLTVYALLNNLIDEDVVI